VVVTRIIGLAGRAKVGKSHIRSDGTFSYANGWVFITTVTGRIGSAVSMGMSSCGDPQQIPSDLRHRQDDYRHQQPECSCKRHNSLRQALSLDPFILTYHLVGLLDG
jgi:hypothetical protein